MKKILTAVLAFAIMSTASFAQKTNMSTKKMPKAKTETPAQTAPAKAPSAKMQKKDGTPDMRYKENKSTTPASNATHLKKDGTPDMRYKENKMNKPATTPAKAK